MAIRSNCPCDIDGVCPYDIEYWQSCEYWCGAEEPQDDPEIWDDYDECGFDPYEGCYTFDC